MLEQVWCEDLVRQIRRHPKVARLLMPGAVAVQCTLFDKSPDNNWLVALHQDRSIPVSARIDTDALTGWSEKEGNLFVQPPSSVLEQLLAIRIHLDPCTSDNGALRLVPGSHGSGVLTVAETERLRQRSGEILVPAPQGAALALKPLLLHASSKGSSAFRRRVLHFLFGPRALPLGLSWPLAI